MNLANRLTIIRIFLIPLFMIILLSKIDYGNYIAAGIFILAASTDGLDGYIARKHNQITRLGKFMDPLADKLLISAALISLVELKQIKAWIAVIIIGREFAVTGLRSIAAAEGIVVSASKLGKIKTVTQIVAISALVLKDFPLTLINENIVFGKYALAVAVFFTIWSGIDYFIKAKPVLRLNK